MTDYAAGPAMQALSEKQRKFVLRMASDPFADHADWARDAGYSDVAEGCKVRAAELLQNPKVKAAVRELSDATLSTLGPPMGIAALLRLVAKPNHKDHARAVVALCDRIGYGPTQEIHVTHSDLTGDALRARLHEVAGRLGLDPAKLIGSDITCNQVIEAEAVEVTAAPEPTPAQKETPPWQRLNRR